MDIDPGSGGAAANDLDDVVWPDMVEGWTGKDADEDESSDNEPRSCTRCRHGMCMDGTCVCEEGWSGGDCNTQICKPVRLFIFHLSVVLRCAPALPDALRES